MTAGRLRAWGFLGALCLSGARLEAQGPPHLDAGGDIAVGSEAERYLRVLQLAGYSRSQAWSIRPLQGGTLALAADSAHPWAARWPNRPPANVPSWFALRPDARLTYNSSYPSSDGVGPAWTGRGVTAELRAGFVGSWWRLRLQVEPVFFVAQNAAFDVAPNGASGAQAYGDARFPGNIDAPQRFGDRPYHRLDAGNSTLSLTLPWVTIGLSSATQSWGPAREYPLSLSANAGGIPRLFAGTNAPINLWITKVQALVIAGHLTESAYAPVTAGATGRYASAAVLVFSPRGLDGLELGVARFIEGPASAYFPSAQQLRRLGAGGLSHTGALNLPNENQLGSAFFRWSIAPAHLEVYGEYYRDDYSLELRRFLQYPDDYRSMTIGLQRVFERSGERIRSARFEIVNGEIPSSNRGERGSGTVPLPPYVHSDVTGGHTNNGLLLGSPGAYGGAAWRVGLDQFDAGGRSSITLERALRLDWLPTASASDLLSPDVVYGLGGEAMRFIGAREASFGATLQFDLNRNLRPGHDVANLRVTMSIRGLR